MTRSPALRKRTFGYGVTPLLSSWLGYLGERYGQDFQAMFEIVLRRETASYIIVTSSLLIMAAARFRSLDMPICLEIRRAASPSYTDSTADHATDPHCRHVEGKF